MQDVFRSKAQVQKIVKQHLNKVKGICSLINLQIVSKKTMASRCAITRVQIIVCLNKRTVKYIAICAIIAFNVYLLRRYYYGTRMDRKSRSISPPVNQLLHAFK